MHDVMTVGEIATGWIKSDCLKGETEDRRTSRAVSKEVVSDEMQRERTDLSVLEEALTLLPHLILLDTVLSLWCSVDFSL